MGKLPDPNRIKFHVSDPSGEAATAMSCDLSSEIELVTELAD